MNKYPPIQIQKKNSAKRWLAIGGALAAMVIALPTVGLYAGHTREIWAAPERIDQIETRQTVMASNQTVMFFRQETQGDDIRALRSESRDNSQKLDRIIGFLQLQTRQRNTNTFAP